MVATLTPSKPGLEEIEHLRARMRRMQAPVMGREIPTHPALSGVVQLRAGGAYALDGATLAMALMAGPSAAGEWCAVVGVPDLGLEAASELGIVLERLILVPDPGESWLEATAALIDVTACVVVRPPVRVTERTAERLAARLRTRSAALLAIGDWPRAEMRLRMTQPRWSGLGEGHGVLTARQVVIEAQRGSAPIARVPVWFPAADGGLRAADRTVTAMREVG
ncbi:hypothetical protein Back2_03830 [Nocardioides baekrokdamisoli]|uniref:Recombinase A n=2 Tax=Nocardioides baekrokdamisoli TaxID=1804624 RepID=A0A3G9ICL9_9ACTN|nr:hypothetical protein Back2_03830 [Nocardioides baekrokdamisoli]